MYASVGKYLWPLMYFTLTRMEQTSAMAVFGEGGQVSEGGRCHGGKCLVTRCVVSAVAASDGLIDVHGGVNMR